MRVEKVRWGILFRSQNRLDGFRAHLVWNSERGTAHTFRTRSEARKYNNDHYGYIRTRKDLRDEPHGWKSTEVVKVRLISEVVE